ncbi:MAG: penicillin-insensitive murein endopeptidase [Polyangiaceae bacterium]|nr:penicillin-insensitive murein endopeptidase [Polyangiaceae bacterium]
MPTPLSTSVRGSVGVPHHGALTDASALPARGPGFVRLRADDVRWGNPRLVAAITRAAARVAAEAPGGEPLVVGDLARRHGGRAPHHRSHRTGRDADLLFYTTTPDGRPRRSPGFVRFEPDGLAPTPDGGFVRLDVARVWLLVRALLLEPEAEIQWLFASRTLEGLLLEEARARAEPEPLVARAASVLRQPGDSAPHDDHLHLRIACTPEEEVAGCEGGGRRWRWLRAAPAPTKLEDAALLAALLSDAPAPGGAASF